MRARTLAVICIITGWACSEPLAPEPPGSFAALSAGHQHTCGLQRDGTAYCWGRNAEGQIGTTQTDAYYPLPQVVSTEQKFSQIAAGYGHTCALTADGVPYCWGSHVSGELGRATRYWSSRRGGRRAQIPIHFRTLAARVRRYHEQRGVLLGPIQ